MKAQRVIPDNKHNPYYIYAPPYTRFSAGVKVLHLLCHHLNKSDNRAFLIIDTKIYCKNPTNFDLNTPILTKEIYKHHLKQKKKPIVIYPEVTAGNPLKASCVVRYVLNYPGLLGGTTSFDKDELVFTYSNTLSKHVKLTDKQTLFIPASDTNIFSPPANKIKRKGTCFFASKYRDGGRELMDCTKGSFEITRGKPDSLKPDEIADLFRRSEAFYTYEDTALATEAVLCGCPAIFIPSDYLKQGPLGWNEVGKDGYCYGISSDDINQAKESVARGLKNYQKTEKKFFNQLDMFSQQTQDKSINTTFSETPIDSFIFSASNKTKKLQRFITKKLTRRLPSL